MTFQTTPNIFRKLRSPTKSGPLFTDPPTTHSSPFLTHQTHPTCNFSLEMLSSPDSPVSLESQDSPESPNSPESSESIRGAIKKTVFFYAFPYRFWWFWWIWWREHFKWKVASWVCLIVRNGDEWVVGGSVDSGPLLVGDLSFRKIFGVVWKVILWTTVRMARLWTTDIGWTECAERPVGL